MFVSTTYILIGHTGSNDTHKSPRHTNVLAKREEGGERRQNLMSSNGQRIKSAKQKKVHSKRTKCMFLIKNTDAERMKRDDALE